MSKQNENFNWKLLKQFRWLIGELKYVKTLTNQAHLVRLEKFGMLRVD